MDNTHSGTERPSRRSVSWLRSGSTRRVAMSVAASAILLGSGAAIGIAVTGGAAASSGTASASTASTAATVSSSARKQCADLALSLRRSGHPKAARLVRALCTDRLVRLLAVGGMHGEITFQAKGGPTTLAFERGTVESVTSSALTVTAKDGTSWAWDLTTGTVIRSAGNTVPEARLTTGEQVLVAGIVSGAGKDARLVRIRPAS